MGTSPITSHSTVCHTTGWRSAWRCDESNAWLTSPIHCGLVSAELEHAYVDDMGRDKTSEPIAITTVMAVTMRWHVASPCGYAHKRMPFPIIALPPRSAAYRRGRSQLSPVVTPLHPRAALSAQARIVHLVPLGAREQSSGCSSATKRSAWRSDVRLGCVVGARDGFTVTRVENKRRSCSAATPCLNVFGNPSSLRTGLSGCMHTASATAAFERAWSSLLRVASAAFAAALEPLKAERGVLGAAGIGASCMTSGPGVCTMGPGAPAIEPTTPEGVRLFATL